MLNTVEKVASEIVRPDGTMLIVHHGSLPGEKPVRAISEPKRITDKSKMGVAFQQTAMPRQRENFIKPRKHDFL